MKYLSVFVFILCISVFSVNSQFSFTGTLQNSAPGVSLWYGPYLYTNPCSNLASPSPLVNYLAFTLFFDSSNASFYFIVGDSYDPYEISVTIYTHFNPSTPCSGLYGKGGLEKNQDFGPSINDGINFVAGTYTIVVSTTQQNINNPAYFALQFTPFTSYASALTPSAPKWKPALGSSSKACSTAGQTSAVYGYYQWVQSTTGYFDIQALFVNDTEVGLSGTTVGVFTALYNGALPSPFSTYCNSNFIYGSESDDTLGGLDYVLLTASNTYSVVVSINTNFFGKVALLVAPSIIEFVQSNTLFSAPILGDLPECDPDLLEDDETANYYFSFSTTVGGIYIVDTSDPLTSDNIYFPLDIETFLYLGNTAVPPEPCPSAPSALIGSAATGTVSSLGFQASDSSIYTVVVTDSDDYQNLPAPDSAFRLYVLTGLILNTSPLVVQSTTSTSSTTSSASSTTATSSSSTTGSSTTASSSTGSDTNGTSSDTTTGSSSTGSSTTGSTSTTSTTGSGLCSTSGCSQNQQCVNNICQCLPGYTVYPGGNCNKIYQLAVFGLNSEKQLGLGQSSGSIVAVSTNVGFVPSVLDIDVGYLHSAVSLSDGSLVTSGDNSLGQLGRTGDQSVFLSIDLLNGLNVVNFATGAYHTIAAVKNGTAANQVLYSWGDNTYYQLGFNTSTGPFSTPQQTTIKSNKYIGGFKGLAAGGQHSLFWNDTQVYGFGSGSGLGSFVSASGSADPVLIFTVAAGDSIAGVVAGWNTTFIWTSNGNAFALGVNTYGNLGLGDTVDRTTPTLIPSFSNNNIQITQIATKLFHTLFLDASGNVYSVGLNNKGQLGINNTTNISVPIKVKGLASLSGVAAGFSHSVAYDTKQGGGAKIYVWGDNSEGELGTGSTGPFISSPFLLPKNQNVNIVGAIAGFYTTILKST